jgi:hypothetical protein
MPDSIAQKASMVKKVATSVMEQLSGRRFRLLTSTSSE